MEGKKRFKISLATIIYIFIILILIMLLSSMLYSYNNIKNMNDKMIDNTEQMNVIEENNEKELEDVNINFEEALVDYIINSIKKYAQDGYILKDTNGDVTASKLSGQEVENNIDNYKKSIENMLEDSSIFSTKFVRNNKECCTYNFEKILNNLNIGTHMGAGIGCYDSKCNKIYEYGKTEIEDYPPTNLNIIKYFGYNASDLVNNILNEIERCSNNNYILKDITGDVTAEKLTLSEAQENREDYAKVINEIIDDTNIFTEFYFEDNKLICKCNFEKVLNKLEIGTHMGAGTSMDEDGIQIFTIE